MKSTCPMQNQLWLTQRELYSTGSRWGLALGVTQILAFSFGVTQILAFLDTNMLWNIGLSNKSETQFPLNDPQLQAYQNS